MPDIRMALIGAGSIGRARVNGAAETPDAMIFGTADLSPLAKTLADEFGIAPHIPIALDLIAAGIPVLVEKPIADTVEQAR
jgi:predicted dehydrogenase